MKVAVVHQPGQLAVVELPVPKPGDYEVLCRIEAGATCTGTDQHLIAGRFPWPVKYPTILGHESIGRVVEIGNHVRNIKVGDLITRVGMPPPSDGSYQAHWGGYAEFGIARDHWAMQEDGLPAAEWQPYRVNQILPADFDPAAATMIITWRETLSYLTRMGIGEGATVLISGSGGNGLAFAAHAANRGAMQVTMIGSPARENTARAIGVSNYYNYQDGAASIIEQISRNPPDGYDYIIDAVGKRGELDAILPLLKHGGVVGIYGIDEWGQCTLNPTRARGTFTFYNGGYDEEETHTQVVSDIQSGKLDASHWLDLEHPYPLTDIQKAFDDLRARKMIKAVIQCASF